VRLRAGDAKLGCSGRRRSRRARLPGEPSTMRFPPGFRDALALPGWVGKIHAVLKPSIKLSGLSGIRRPSLPFLGSGRIQAAFLGVKFSARWIPVGKASASAPNAPSHPSGTLVKGPGPRIDRREDEQCHRVRCNSRPHQYRHTSPPHRKCQRGAHAETVFASTMQTSVCSLFVCKTHDFRLWSRPTSAGPSER